MAVEGYDNTREMARDIRDAHSASQIARMLASLALLASIAALALSMWALSKSGDAQSTANRAMETAQNR